MQRVSANTEDIDDDTPHRHVTRMKSLITV